MLANPTLHTAATTHPVVKRLARAEELIFHAIVMYSYIHHPSDIMSVRIRLSLDNDVNLASFLLRFNSEPFQIIWQLRLSALENSIAR